MHTIIIVPPMSEGPNEHLKIAPGERIVFGRQAPPDNLVLAHEGVSRFAGEIAAQGVFWTLSNHSVEQTYVVENPEGAGEHVKVAPGRLDAPVPFEFSRVVLPAAGDLLSFDVWAPRHAYGGWRGAPGAAVTAPAFSLDRSTRYFAVLAALCEPRLRVAPHAPLPTIDQVVERLRPTWPAAGRSSVAWNIDYLAVKLRLRPGPDAVPEGRRAHGKKESLVSLALRFDLVREEDLRVLAHDRGKAGR
ncbi:FHA domain-containing protein [Streptomyces roseofulvus]|uniref:FHA domain-containing protein n=2 Tax=Streptomyces TaxID=1883 RepID=A0ABU4KD60_9ACTN|nr:FHA domain-containing protein [Streptomyces roseolus]MDX2295285.1 FHA domain-containing protein [Streptomyces roseolus]